MQDSVKDCQPRADSFVKRRIASLRRSANRVAQAGLLPLGLTIFAYTTSQTVELVESTFSPLWLRLSLSVFLTIASAISLSIVMRHGLKVPYLAIVRGELDRRHRGEKWSFDAALALSLYPLLASWISTPTSHLFTRLGHLAFVCAILCGQYTSGELSGFIQRFAPPRRQERARSRRMRRHRSLPFLLFLLVLGCVPWCSDGMAWLRAYIANAFLHASDRLSEFMFNDLMVRPLAAILHFIGHLVFYMVVATWAARLPPTLKNILTHANYTAPQGHRFAYVWEILAGGALILICIGLVGQPPLSAPACIAALVTLGLLGLLYGDVGSYLDHLLPIREGPQPRDRE